MIESSEQVTASLLVATAIGAAAVVACWPVSARVTPDGRFYLSSPRPAPYSLRWLGPLLCGGSIVRWRVLTVASLVATCPALALYLGVSGCVAPLFGVLLYVGLTGLWRFNVLAPVLVDAPAMLFALLAAVAAMSGQAWLAVALGCVAGGFKESAPLFAAVFAWSWLPLVGLAVPVVAWFTVRRAAAPSLDWLERPVRSAIAKHRERIGHPGYLVLPWGVLLAALWGEWTFAAVAALALGYAQLVTAQDVSRLYLWAAPAVLVVAVGAIPPGWYLPLLLVHWFNPFETVS